ncbi:MAG: tetratricopeptide repeat protein [Nitrospira sp.]|nr:tetratricopeptide repeat protein [Nitrospira sp.]
MAPHLKIEIKIFLLIAVFSSVVYVNSLHNSFHFDDQHYVVANTYIRALSNIPSFFKGTQFSSFEKEFATHYRPLLVASYSVNYAVGGLNPVGYHIVNLLFHIGSALLVFLILQAILVSSEKLEEQKAEGRRLKAEGSKMDLISKSIQHSAFTGHYFIPLASSLIFAVHPFNSEVVNYITARSSVMCSFFYLLAFYCWIKYRSQQTEARSQEQEVRKSLIYYVLPITYCFYLLSLLAFVLAILTKEIAITLPVMLFIYDLYFVREVGVRLLITHSSSRPSAFSLQSSVFSLIRDYLPFTGLVAIPYLVFRSSVLRWLIGMETSVIYSNLLIQPIVLLRYLQLMFFPAGLTIDHIVTKPSAINDSAFILSVIAILFILLAGYHLFKKGREWKLLSFFILWFFITLLPTTLVPLNAILQENRGYLAGIVFPVFAGVLLMKLPMRLAIAFLVIIISLYSAGTIRANAFWKNDFTLWSRAAGISPSSPRAHDNMGLAYMGMGDYNHAIQEFENTLNLNPQYYLAYYNAGVAYQLQKRFDLARSSYEKCLEIKPDFFRVYYNLGIVYKKTGEIDKAISVYEKAVLIDPRHPFVYNNLGIVLTERGDFEKAESVFKRAIEIKPGYAKAYYNLGTLYYKMKRYQLAADAFKSAVNSEPDYKEARQMLGVVMKKMP